MLPTDDSKQTNFISTTNDLFLMILDSEIAMTSKLIIVDWIQGWKSSKFSEREPVFKWKREIYSHHGFLGFLFD